MKNIALLLMPVISQIKSFFYDDKTRVDWFLFYDFVNSNNENIGVVKAWAIYFYTVPVNFIILSACLLWPRGIYRWVKEFIFTLCVLDLLHVFLYAGKSFVFTKLLVSIGIVLFLEYKRKRTWLF